MLDSNITQRLQVNSIPHEIQIFGDSNLDNQAHLSVSLETLIKSKMKNEIRVTAFRSSFKAYLFASN